MRLAHILVILLLGVSIALGDSTVDALVNAKLELAVLQQRYTDNHPKMVEARTRMATLSRAARSVSPQDYAGAIQRRTSELKIEEAELSLRYSEKHPKRADISAKLQALQQEVIRVRRLGPHE